MQTLSYKHEVLSPPALFFSGRFREFPLGRPLKFVSKTLTTDLDSVYCKKKQKCPIKGCFPIMKISTRGSGLASFPLVLKVENTSIFYLGS